MTALCGMAVNFAMLFVARVGTAIGEAGGSLPSHSLISDYFPKAQARHGLRHFRAGGSRSGRRSARRSAVGAISTWAGGLTFMLVGIPGLLLALLVRLTVIEPPRGIRGRFRARHRERPRRRACSRSALHLWAATSFRHMSLATALHSGRVVRRRRVQQRVLPALAPDDGVARPATGSRSSPRSAASGRFSAALPADQAAAGGTNDRRWYLWVPGIGDAGLVPFQFFELSGARSVGRRCRRSPSMMFMAAAFFGPSFAMTQALATLRMRSVATSVAAVRADADRAGHRSVARRIHQRSAEPFTGRGVPPLRARHRRPGQRLGGAFTTSGARGCCGRTWRRRNGWRPPDRPWPQEPRRAMKLTDSERSDARRPRWARRKQKAMELLVRYAEALGAERFVDTNNVAGVPDRRIRFSRTTT